MLETVALAVAIVSPICSAAYVVGMVRAELRALRRDVDRAHGRVDTVEKRLALVRR